MPQKWRLLLRLTELEQRVAALEKRGAAAPVWDGAVEDAAALRGQMEALLRYNGTERKEAGL